MTSSAASVLASPFAAGVRPVLGSSDTTALEDTIASLATVGEPGHTSPLDDAHRIDQLRLLEQVKAAAAAAQARIAVQFEASQLAEQKRNGVPGRSRGRGIADQIALARGCSAGAGSRHLGFARAMVLEMPHAFALLTTGELGEWAGTVLVRETACLTVEDRIRVDQLLCAPGTDGAPVAAGLSVRQLEARATTLATELDAEAVVRRSARARKDRRVTIRPAPDTMAIVAGLLPVGQGVAAWANLTATAQRMKSAGDERSLDQIRADLFVERLTGQASADAVPTEIQLVMTPNTLLGATDHPARIGEHIIPAALARQLATHPGATTWLRRVFTDPITNVITSIDPRRRRFHGALARLITTRDQHCRMPGCDAAIAHLDHVEPVRSGGPTTRDNGQGLCERHNYVKEVPGWTSRVVDRRPGRQTIETTTPTGHRYRSHAPPVLSRRE